MCAASSLQSTLFVLNSRLNELRYVYYVYLCITNTQMKKKMESFSSLFASQYEYSTCSLVHMRMVLVSMVCAGIYPFESDIIFRKSVNDPYVSKSSWCLLCGTIFCGRGSANGIGNRSGITE